MSNIAVTTRVALDWFEFDPYGLKPDWWRMLVVTGRAFEHKAHATFSTDTADWKAKTGDRIYIIEGNELGVWTPEQFKIRCRMLDTERDAANLFTVRIMEVIRTKIDELKALRR